MSLGEIHYSEESLATVIRETLRQEKPVEHSRVVMEIQGDQYIFQVHITLNTFENALLLCQEYQKLAHQSIIKMFDLPDVLVHLHLENIVLPKKEKE